MGNASHVGNSNNSTLGKLERKLDKETKQNFSLLVEATGEVKGVVHARGGAAVETLDAVEIAFVGLT